MRTLYGLEAIREGLAEEMRRDPRVFLMGEDIGLYGGAMGVTAGLFQEFGPERVRNTPIAENGFVGLAVGAALMGHRPVVEIMFMDFIALAMDQIVNQAAKFRDIYGEQAKVPLVIRTPGGGGRCYGPSHSQSLEAWFMHVPGLKVVAPSCPADFKGLLLSSIRDDDPVLFVESKMLYGEKGEVPEGDCPVPLGRACVARPGEDLSMISYSRGVKMALECAEVLSQKGIEVEVVDLRTLSPLDEETVLESATKTGKVLLIEEGCETAGVSAEVGFRIMSQCFEDLDAPVRRVCGLDWPVPCSPGLEEAVLPSSKRILQEAIQLLNE